MQYLQAYCPHYYFFLVGAFHWTHGIQHGSPLIYLNTGSFPANSKKVHFPARRFAALLAASAWEQLKLKSPSRLPSSAPVLQL